MEFMNYGDLQKYMPEQGGSFLLEETQDIVSQVLEGLFYMHENRFAHRDLKPAVRITFFTHSRLGHVHTDKCIEHPCKIKAARA